ncbi:MAG: hypothetical protein U0359_16370 [Byssovorax sp.]
MVGEGVTAKLLGSRMRTSVAITTRSALDVGVGDAVVVSVEAHAGVFAGADGDVLLDGK